MKKPQPDWAAALRPFHTDRSATGLRGDAK
jgi:hypothetical protein